MTARRRLEGMFTEREIGELLARELARRNAITNGGLYDCMLTWMTVHGKPSCATVSCYVNRPEESQHD